MMRRHRQEAVAAYLGVALALAVWLSSLLYGEVVHPTVHYHFSPTPTRSVLI